MNDFLQNLRNGQAEKARAPKTRKSYDNSYHYNSGTPRFHSYSGYQNTRNQQMKRSSMPPSIRRETSSPSPRKTLPSIPCWQMRLKT